MIQVVFEESCLRILDGWSPLLRSNADGLGCSPLPEHWKRIRFPEEDSPRRCHAPPPLIELKNKNNNVSQVIEISSDGRLQIRVWSTLR